MVAGNTLLSKKGPRSGRPRGSPSGAEKRKRHYGYDPWTANPGALTARRRSRQRAAYYREPFRRGKRRTARHRGAVQRQREFDRRNRTAAVVPARRPGGVGNFLAGKRRLPEAAA